MPAIIPSLGPWKVESCLVSSSWQGKPLLLEKQGRGLIHCRTPVRSKLQSSRSSKDQNGDAASRFPFHPLFAHSLSFLKKFTPSELARQLHSPSLLIADQRRRQGKKAILSLFNYPGKWQKSPRDLPKGGRHLASHWFYDRVTKFFRSSVWIAAILLVGGGLLYGQSKARDYLEVHIVPSLAIMVGAHLQRHVEFGKVGSLTPLGFRVGPSSVGTHEVEFSCAELPSVDIKFKPLATLRRGQLVVDAVLVEPSLLISQKEDWSWLGIPSASEKTRLRHSSEVGIDERTAIRRLARERTAHRLAEHRIEAARKAAEHGYQFHDYSDPAPTTETIADIKVERPHGLLDKAFNKLDDLLDEKKRGSAVAFEIDGATKGFQGGKAFGSKLARAFDESEVQFDEKSNATIMAYRVGAADVETFDEERLRKIDSLDDSIAPAVLQKHVKDPVKDAEKVMREEADERFQEASMEDEEKLERQERGGASKRKLSLRTSLQTARKWMGGKVMKPVHQVLIKRCLKNHRNSLSRALLQRKNLDRSAAAARSHFKRLDRVLAEKASGSSADEVGVSCSSSSSDPTAVEEHTEQIVLPDESSDEMSLNGRADAAGDTSNELPSSFAAKHEDREVELLDQSANVIFPVWGQGTGTDAARRLEGFGSRILEESKKKMKEGWSPVAVDTVHLRNGSLTLIAYGDTEPRIVENVNGCVKLGSDYERITAFISGRPRTWKADHLDTDGGKLTVKVEVDLVNQAWDVKIRGHHLFAPLLERLVEIPIDWSRGRATGEVHLWMAKEDTFPNFGGQVDVKDLSFHIWEAPSEFKGVGGTICLQGQRLFFHNASGWYGSVPLSVSGDFDLNPEDGEYRLSCQVPGVEANALMMTLKAQPPPYPLAGTLKAVVYCRGPLDAPIFEGTAETAGGKQIALTLNATPTMATQAVEQNEGRGAVAAYDRIPFSSCFASFTFNTDDCVAHLYGIRATPVGGGEIRGAGTMWICPEGEVDGHAVTIDCSGHFSADSVLRYYIPAGVELPPLSFGPVHGEAKIRGSILMPIFDVKWEIPKAQGSLDGAHGEISVSREAFTVNASAFAFDLFTRIHTKYPRISRRKPEDWRPPLSPAIEGLDLDVRLRGFDIMSLSPSSILPSSISPGGAHMKVTGKMKFQGRVPQNSSAESPFCDGLPDNGTQHTRLVGDVTLSGIKLNQLLVAPHLTGSMDMSPDRFKLQSAGRVDEHLSIHVSKAPHSPNEVSMQPASAEVPREMVSLSLQRGQLHMGLSYRPEHSAKLEIRNLLLDELEFASLRGAVPKAEVALNLQKRRGQGSLSVRRPRFSGLQGESLDVAARWSGDVVTLEKSVLEQASSRYELQGEYVLPRPRSNVEKGREKAMRGQLGSIISAMGRWRLRLDVPRAEISELLPVARLLSRSSDPAVVSRSKELFLEGVQRAGFSAVNLKQQLEYIQKNKIAAAPEDFSPESMPLPGLAELRGQWHGSLEASGGGNGDTTADFDLRGEDWEWGAYKTQKVTAIGDYSNNDGLRLENFFIQKDTATLHADGTLLGPKPNLHFAVLNFPIGLVPPLLHVFQSAPEPLPAQGARSLYTPIKGTLYMEGDLRGHLAKPQCDVQIRLLDGAVGGLSLGRAEVAASITSANRLAFNAVLEPATHTGHVRVRGSLPMGPGGLEEYEEDKDQEIETGKLRRARGRGRERNRDRDEDDGADKRENRERGEDEGWEVRLAESLKALDGEALETGAVQVDAAVKDGGMMLITAISPGLHWLQGNADVTLKVRGTVNQPVADGVAAFQKVSISSPVLPRPLTNLGGTISVKTNHLCVESLEGRVGRRGHVQVSGKLPIKGTEAPNVEESIEVKAEALEVRARNAFSGQVDSQIKLFGSLFEPEVTGLIKLSHGEAYLSQEKGANSPVLAMTNPSSGITISQPEEAKEKDDRAQLPIAVRLRALKLQLGPELRMVYPLILNFAVSGELELNGFADPLRVKPKGTLTFENGDVNLVATQVRLNRDHPNRAKFEPEQGLDPSLDLALVGADWQLKVQGRARNWQDNLVITSTRSGEQDAFTRIEAARVFESQLAESLLEGDGQLAFKKLAAATVETLMPKIEGKGEFGQARWRLVSAPQIPNLLSLDPTTDPFKSLANLSFGTEVEVQLGKHLQASVVRQLKESEMATQWTLLYQLNSKLRLLFSSIPSVDNRILFEYSATSQN